MEEKYESYRRHNAWLEAGYILYKGAWMPRSLISTLLTSFFLIIVKDTGASSAQWKKCCISTWQYLVIFASVMGLFVPIYQWSHKLLDFVQVGPYKKEEWLLGAMPLNVLFLTTTGLESTISMHWNLDKQHSLVVKSMFFLVLIFQAKIIFVKNTLKSQNCGVLFVSPVSYWTHVRTLEATERCVRTVWGVKQWTFSCGQNKALFNKRVF